MGEGKPISIVPGATGVTNQKAEDVLAYREKMKTVQINQLIDIMGTDEELELYGS